jgi:hypothetical protein
LWKEERRIVRVFRNEKLIKRRAKVGRVLGFSGLGLLFIGLLMSFRPEYFLQSYLVLILAIILASIGTYNAGKWLADPRADQALEAALRGFDNKHLLYNYLLPAEHVLLSPYGIYVFTVTRMDGKITYDGKRWRQKFSLLRLLQGLSQERLGNPIQQLREDVDQVVRWLNRRMGDDDVPVEGIVVFTNPKAELDVADSPVPVVPVKKLKSYLRRTFKAGRRFPEETRRKLEQILGEETGQGA